MQQKSEFNKKMLPEHNINHLPTASVVLFFCFFGGFFILYNICLLFLSSRPLQV